MSKSTPPFFPDPVPLKLLRKSDFYGPWFVFFNEWVPCWPLTKKTGREGWHKAITNLVAPSGVVGLIGFFDEHLAVPMRMPPIPPGKSEDKCTD